MGRSRAEHIIGTVKVDIDHLVPMRVLGLVKTRTGRGKPGIGKAAIYTPMIVQSSGKCAIHSLCTGHIANICGDLGAVGRQRFNRLSVLFGAPAPNGDIAAALGKAFRHA